MPSYENYKDDYRKRASNREDLFNLPQQMVLPNQVNEEWENRLIDWATFYRRNVQYFCLHYLGIKLHFFQRIWIYLMFTRDSFVAIASRAVGKTWLVGLAACCRAILFPKSEIVVVASTKEQAGILVEEKIKQLMDMSPNLCREISNVTTNLNKWQVDFHNGSIIKIVAGRDSSRGKRSTFTIYEEFRLIDKFIIDSVIRPFSYIRQTGWLNKPEWAKYAERSKEIFISSAYHKGLWWWDETRKTINAMLRGENVGFIALDVRVAIEHHIKNISDIQRDLSKMDEITALEEVYNIPWGENSDAFFRLKDMNRSRKVEKAFYPQRSDTTYNPKKNPYGIPRTEGEIRLLACDLAQRSGRNNDLSITWCIRLLPTTKGYLREVCYGESFSGENSIKQALRIKQVHHDFDADAIVMDVGAGGGGIPIYDMLGQKTEDSERGIEYPAMTIMHHTSIEDSTYDELKARTSAINAIPIIYPISATVKLNSSMAIDMKDKFKKRLVSLLVDETRAEDYLIRKKAGEYMNNEDINAKTFFMQPYTQTSLLVNEAVALAGVLTAGNIKLVEPPGARKDRIVALMMGSYYASFLDSDLLKDGDNLSDNDAILAMTQIL